MFDENTLSNAPQVHFRMRLANTPGTKVNAWSNPLLLNTSGTKPELEELVELLDAEGVSQPVNFEVRRHHETMGFRIRLYNRYWLFNLTGYRLQVIDASLCVRVCAFVHKNIWICTYTTYT
jgi:hypothetical protein